MNNAFNIPIEFQPKLLFPNEVFLPITEQAVPGIMNYYMISNYGRVFNLYSGKFVAAGFIIDKTIWIKLTTIIDKRISTFQIELDKLIMLVFNYSNQFEYVNHKDGVVNNYFVDNLEWSNQSDNSNQKVVNGQIVAFGSGSYAAKLNDAEVHAICKLLEKNDMSLGDISRKFNISVSIISAIKNKRIWTHISCQYNIPDKLENYIGENNPSAKLTEKEVKKICELIVQDRYSDSEIAAMVSPFAHKETISRIRRGKAWKQVSRNYNFKLVDNLRGENNPTAKITEAQAITICELLQKGIGSAEISKMLGINKSTVDNIKRRATWTQISCKYDFHTTRRNDMKGENVHNSIYTNSQIRQVCKLLSTTNLSHKEIADKVGVHKSLVDGICSRVSWTHISKDYRWPHRKDKYDDSTV